MKEPKPCAESAPGVELRIIPNAKKTEVVGMHGNAVKVKISGPALDGKANGELMEFIATLAQAPLRAVRLLSGAKSRDKILAVDGLSAGALREKLISSIE